MILLRKGGTLINWVVIIRWIEFIERYYKVSG